MPVIKSHLDIPEHTHAKCNNGTNTNLPGGFSPTFYNYSLIYSFIEQMFIECPL